MGILFGVVGLLLISYAVWVKGEQLQDSLFIAGGLCLLFYSITIRDIIFIILETVFVVSSLVELLRLKRK